MITTEREPKHWTAHSSPPKKLFFFFANYTWKLLIVNTLAVFLLKKMKHYLEIFILFIEIFFLVFTIVYYSQ